jgi:hypothetical protein
VTDLNARLDTIHESIAIASGPTENTNAGYIEWQDAVSHLLDSTPGLVAALRAVLDACDQAEETRRGTTFDGTIFPAIVSAEDIRSRVAAALIEEPSP